MNHISLEKEKGKRKNKKGLHFQASPQITRVTVRLRKKISINIFCRGRMTRLMSKITSTDRITTYHTLQYGGILQTQLIDDGTRQQILYS